MMKIIYFNGLNNNRSLLRSLFLGRYDNLQTVNLYEVTRNFLENKNSNLKF